MAQSLMSYRIPPSQCHSLIGRSCLTVLNKGARECPVGSLSVPFTWLDFLPWCFSPPETSHINLLSCIFLFVLPDPTVFSPHPFCFLGGLLLWTASHRHSGPWPFRFWLGSANVDNDRDSTVGGGQGWRVSSRSHFLQYCFFGSPTAIATAKQWSPTAAALSHWVLVTAPFS